MELNGKEAFEKEVLQSKTPVLVDFWAAWCGPCKAYSPVVDSVAKDAGSKIKLVKINVDDNEELASKYGVSSIPTTLLVEKGKIKASFAGAVPAKTLKDWLKENL